MHASCCRRGHEPRMTTRERLLLTPFEKFVKYGIIPWKFILNISLVSLVTGQILFINSQESDYLQAQSRNWYFYFFPQDYDFSTVTWNVFTIDDAIAAVQYGITNYYSLNQLSPDSYSYVEWAGDGSGLPRGPQLTVVSYSNTASLVDSSQAFSPETAVAYYSLNSTYLGPLDPSVNTPESLRSFFRSLVSMTLSYPPLDNYAFGSRYRNCYRWSVAVNYDFTTRGNVVTSLEQDVIGTCDVYASSSAALAAKGNWLNLAVILLSLLHSGLVIKALVRSALLLNKVRAWAARQAEALATEAERAAQRSADGAGQGQGQGQREGGHTASPDLGLQSTGLRMSTIAFSRGTNSKPKGTDKDADDMSSGLLAHDSLGQAGMGKSSGGTDGARSGRSSPRPMSRKPSGPGPLQFDINTGLDYDGTGDGLVVTANVPGAGGQAKAVPIMFAGNAAGAGSSSGANGQAGGSGNSGTDGVAAPGVDAATLAAAAAALRVQLSDLPWRERLRFLNGWALLSITADCLNIAASAANLRDLAAHLPHDESRSLVVGLGSSLLWLGMLRYMEHNRDMFTLVLTLRRALPRVARMLVGVLPVFVGYCLFATVVFGDRIPRFADIRTSFITLFANLNGDVVRETFMAIVEYHPITGQFFFYSFISLHIYVILNIVIAIVEESYFLTTQKSGDIAKALSEDRQALGLEEQGEDGGPGGDGGGDAGPGSARPELAADSLTARSGQSDASSTGPSTGPGAVPVPPSSEASVQSPARGTPVRKPALSRALSGRGGVAVEGAGTGTGPTSGVALALAAGLNPTLMSPNPDYHSVKARLTAAASAASGSTSDAAGLKSPGFGPASGASASSSGVGSLTALLNLAEWDEVITGRDIGAGDSGSESTRGPVEGGVPPAVSRGKSSARLSSGAFNNSSGSSKAGSGDKQ